MHLAQAHKAANPWMLAERLLPLWLAAPLQWLTPTYVRDLVRAVHECFK